MSSGDGYDEVYRLKSNHKELLMHKHTLEKQLEMKQTQLKELKKAIEACQAQLEDDAPIVRKRDRSSISSSTPIAPAKRTASLDA